jgi:hypothetical protein
MGCVAFAWIVEVAWPPSFLLSQAAERAVAESNREIGGYPVAAINIPTDRLTHYGLRQVIASLIQAGASRMEKSSWVIPNAVYFPCSRDICSRLLVTRWTMQHPLSNVCCVLYRMSTLRRHPRWRRQQRPCAAACPLATAPPVLCQAELGPWAVLARHMPVPLACSRTAASMAMSRIRWG